MSNDDCHPQLMRFGGFLNQGNTMDLSFDIKYGEEAQEPLKRSLGQGSADGIPQEVELGSLAGDEVACYRGACLQSEGRIGWPWSDVHLEDACLPYRERYSLRGAGADRLVHIERAYLERALGVVVILDCESHGGAVGNCDVRRDEAVHLIDRIGLDYGQGYRAGAGLRLP